MKKIGKMFSIWASVCLIVIAILPMVSSDNHHAGDNANNLDELKKAAREIKLVKDPLCGFLRVYLNMKKMSDPTFTFEDYFEEFIKPRLEEMKLDINNDRIEIIPIYLD
ncbi:MAG: hypothetical protein QXL17_04395 [Candidatus Thermoplasmatota archaeon]